MPIQKDEYGYVKANIRTRYLDRSIRQFKARAYTTDKVLFKQSHSAKIYLSGVATKNCPEEGRPERINEYVYMKGGYLFSKAIDVNKVALVIPNKKKVNCRVRDYESEVKLNGNMLSTIQYVYTGINIMTVDWIEERNDLKLASADSVWHYIQVRKTEHKLNTLEDNKFPTSKAVSNWVDKHKTADSIKNSLNNTSGQGCTTAYAVKQFVNKQSSSININNATYSNTGCTTAYAVKQFVNKQKTSGSISGASSSNTGCTTAYAVKSYVTSYVPAYVRSYYRGISSSYISSRSSYYDGQPTLATSKSVYNYVNKTSYVSSSNNGCITSSGVYNYITNKLNDQAIVARAFGGTKISTYSGKMSFSFINGSMYATKTLTYNSEIKAILYLEIFNSYVVASGHINGKDLKIKAHYADHKVPKNTSSKWNATLYVTAIVVL